MWKGLLLAAICVARPQSFQVASVRQHLPSSNIRLSGDRFIEDAVSLKALIMDAYDVKPFQILGLPSWGNSVENTYDIDARVRSGQASPGEVRRMLQALLTQRFRLKLHRETKDLLVYALVAGRNGPRLTKLVLGQTCESGGGGGKGGRAVVKKSGLEPESWDRIVARLAVLVDRPVIDKTGFSGTYCALYGQNPMAALDRTAPVAGEVAQRWGLLLEARTDAVELLVIDHVERPAER